MTDKPDRRKFLGGLFSIPLLAGKSSGKPRRKPSDVAERARETKEAIQKMREEMEAGKAKRLEMLEELRSFGPNLPTNKPTKVKQEKLEKLQSDLAESKARHKEIMDTYRKNIAEIQARHGKKPKQ